jgi:hypothetical protein
LPAVQTSAIGLSASDGNQSDPRRIQKVRASALSLELPVSNPDHAEIEKTRSSIVDLMRQEYQKHALGKLDPYEFGAAVAPLVNALAALALMEKQEHPPSGLGEASRSDD